MRVLEGLQPERVFTYFETICAIPHGSGNVTKIADYLCFFARLHGLEYLRDKANNVVIKKDATPGYEEADGVILQGHVDMVCAKTPDSDHDFLKAGPDIWIDGDWIRAKGTTLGGDDGIAVAMMLAILDAEDIPHPSIEAVFTTDEEIGMDGAKALDMSCLKNRVLLNMDSEEEGILTVSCAGGAGATITIPVSRAPANEPVYAVTVTGLLGGHSGTEIGKGRANAVILAGRFMKETGAKLISVDGGEADNAIMAECRLVVSGSDLEEKAKAMENVFRGEFPNEDIRLLVEKENREAAVVDFLMGDFFASAPYGVQKWSRDIDGLVQTSLNIGTIETEQDKIILGYSVRSSVNHEKEDLLETLSKLAKKFGGEMRTDGEYPAWEFRKNSKLRDRMTRIYADMYGKEAKVEAIHAGLECGLFSDALKGLDAVSYGPNMQNIHTPKEALSISSVGRTWAFTLAVLADMNND